MSYQIIVKSAQERHAIARWKSREALARGESSSLSCLAITHLFALRAPSYTRSAESHCSSTWRLLNIAMAERSPRTMSSMRLKFEKRVSTRRRQPAPRERESARKKSIEFDIFSLQKAGVDSGAITAVETKYLPPR